MRPIRNKDPSLYRIISIRTCEARLWMIPSNNLCKLLGGILARYQEIFEIEIYAYFFLSNHSHMLIKAPKGNVDEFCENVNREIARRVNWLLRREGRLWSRRYDDIPIGNADDLLEAFLYVTTNATRHGLLKNSKEWPGLHSYSHCINQTDRKFTFHHFSAEGDQPRTTRHTLKISPLPQFSKMKKEERGAHIQKLLIQKMEQYAEDRRSAGQGFLKLEDIISQEAGERPQNISRSKRPFCYTKCLEIWRAKRKELTERRMQYRKASFEYRLGKLIYNFPAFSFKPPLHRAPRFEPFKPFSSVTEGCTA